MSGAMVETVREEIDPLVFDPSIRHDWDEPGFRMLVGEIGLRAAQPRRPAEAPYLVGVSGPGGSGKTTLTHSLAEYFAKQYDNDIPVVSADDFFPPGDDQFRLTADWDNYDRGAMRLNVMVPLLNGYEATYRLRNWRTGELQGERRIAPTVGMVLMEGVGLLHPDTRDFFDFTIWRDLPLEQCQENGIRRMGEETRSHWQDIWTPNDGEFIRNHDPAAYADFVYDTPLA